MIVTSARVINHGAESREEEMATVTGTSGADLIRPGQISPVPGVTGVSGATDLLSGADSILGGDGNDTLQGGAEADTLSGGAGDDSFIIDASDPVAGDRILGGSGIDTLDARTAGVADLSGLTLLGIERWTLRNGETLISPGQFAGVTFIDAPNNFFTLRGSIAGTYDLSAVAFGTFYQGFFGSAGHDSIIGAVAGEALSGAAGDDTLSGGEGNDTLAGGTGADLLLGDLGDDRASFANGDIAAGDRFEGGDGTDTADFRSAGITDITGTSFLSVESILVRNGNTLIGAGQFTGVSTTIDAPNNFFNLTGSAAGTYDLSGVSFGLFFQGFTGSTGNDSILGNGAGNVLSGGDGADTVNGGAGNDTLTGGLGLDTLQGGTGDDLGIYTATDIALGELFNGGANADTVDFRTNGIADITGVRLVSVESVLLRNGGTAIGAGQFTGLATSIDAPNNFFNLTGSAAGLYDFTTVAFGQFFQGFTGSAGNDSILGNAAGNVLSGGDGADTVDGAAGNDTLRGGIGGDTLRGGDDDDIAIYASDDLAPGEFFDGGTGNDTADFRTNGVTVIADVTLSGVESVQLRNGTTQVAPGQFAGAVTVIDAPNNFFSLAGSVAGNYDFTTVTFGQFFQGFSGTDGADSILGSTGTEVLNGGGGDDTVAGNDGHDTLNGGAGGDALFGGLGDDRAVWAIGEIGLGESFEGGDGLDLADFRANGLADITGVALSGVENVQLRNGNTLIGAGQFTGVTTTIEAPNNFYTLGASSAGIFDLSGLTFGSFFQGFTGSAGADSILGNDAGTVLNGGGAEDTIDGAGGNDTLSGGTGRDALRGGLGDDRAIWAVGDIVAGESFDGGDGADTADFRANNLGDITGVAFAGVESILLRNGSTLIGNAQFSGVTTTIDAPNNFFTLGAAGAGTHDFTNVAFGAFFQGFTGSTGTDLVFGNGAGNILNGAGGSDLLLGGGGNDALNGGAGTDIALFVGNATDFLVTVNGATTTVQDLRVGAPSGADTLTGVELIRYVNGVDLRGGEAGETLLGTARFDLLVGNTGADTLVGGAAADTLLGGAGDDSLDGGAGQDALNGGGGRDSLAGGADQDSFRVDGSALGPAAGALVTFVDFAPVIGERIDLAAIDADATLAGDQAFQVIGSAAFTLGNAGRLRFEVAGGDLRVEGDVDGDAVADLSLLILGQTTPALSWFVL